MVLIDNQMSLLSGREVLGFSKGLADFSPAGARSPVGELANSILVQPYGGNYQPNAPAGFRPMIQLNEIGLSTPAPRPLAALTTPFAELAIADGDTPKQAADMLAGNLIELAPKFYGPLGETEAVYQFTDGLTSGPFTQVFLKQFRAEDHQEAACYQAVIEAEMELRNARPGPCLPWQMRISHMDTHPIVDELGISLLSTCLAFRLEADLIVEDGRVVAP